jgi:opacity protein-like surface antigen
MIRFNIKALMLTGVIVLCSYARATPSYYAHFNIGYVNHPWQAGLGATWEPVTWENGNGGLDMGINFGAKLTNNIATEVGYFLLPTTKLHAAAGVFGNASAFDNDIHTNIIYGAAVLLLPIESTKFSIVGKVGIAYVRNTGDFSGFNNWYDIKSYYSPLFAIGLEYTINSRLTVNSSYTNIQGLTENINTPVETFSPNIHILNLGIGYLF